MPRRDTSRQSGWRLYALLCAAAALPRAAYLWSAPPAFESVYWRLSDDILHSGTLGFGGTATTVFEPLYPLFLAAARVLTGDRVRFVQLIQAGIAAVAVVPLYRLTLRMTSRHSAGIAAAVAFSMYPLLVRHAIDPSETALLTTLLISFAAGVATATTVGGAALAGVWLGLAALTRSVVWPLIALVPLMTARRNPARAAAVASAAALVLLPYLLRNYETNGTLLPARGGANLFISNTRFTAALMPEYGPDILGTYANAQLARVVQVQVSGSPEAERAEDAAFAALTVGEIRRQPWTILWLKARNVWYFFSPRLVPYREQTPLTRVVFDDPEHIHVENGAPRPPMFQVMYSASYGVVLLFALGGIYMRRAQLADDALLWAIVATFTAAHVAFFPTTRYRVPIDFVLIVYAAAAFDCALIRLTNQRRDFRVSAEIAPAASVES